MKVKHATISVRDMEESVRFYTCEDPNGVRIALIEHSGGLDEH